MNLLFDVKKRSPIEDLDAEKQVILMCDRVLMPLSLLTLDQIIKFSMIKGAFYQIQHKITITGFQAMGKVKAIADKYESVHGVSFCRLKKQN